MIRSGEDQAFQVLNPRPFNGAEVAENHQIHPQAL